MKSRYLLEIIFVDGLESTLYHEGSYESLVQRFTYYDTKSDVVNVKVFKLKPELMEKFK